ncbi:hypothetical protein CPB84DRAFT_1830164 [Gymnopilus junonius]|uniref:Zinc-finger domain-containing protein n=1 Tax=Gymnopilus junonius TaxID=109634 RepID=A0A9P5TFI3_GYMJU|nr:hypothetical protein CPB84DRAFT_1830164 [Gymnopilus junonius]
MSATPNSHSVVRKVNKAYVLVPPSPLNLSSYRPLRTPVHVAGGSKLKENMPLRPSQLAMSQQAASSPSLKRKLSERDVSTLVFDRVNPVPKRSKLSTAIPLKNTHIVQPTAPAENACPEFPNGFAYCHQCNKKRDLAATIHCTSVGKQRQTKDKNVKGRLCPNKYCKSCLKNRYDEDFEILKSEAHDTSGTLNFRCPQCKGLCNCPRCRKSLGLDAIGRIKPKSKELQAIARSNKSLKVEVVIEIKKPLFKPKPKPLPSLKWTQIPTGLTRNQADDRIFIREFVLRFSDILDPAIAKIYLEELEFISGHPRKQDDEEDTASWVSEACIKAMLIGLLGLLSKNSGINVSKLMKATVKDLRSAGVNLNKLWAALASLRDDVGKLCPPGEAQLTFPDPLPPSAFSAATARPLRNTRQLENSVNVVQSIQMIPVLVSLIHSVLETTPIREDIDQCAKDSKDFARDVREATRIENERWEKVKGEMETAPKDKAQRDEKPFLTINFVKNRAKRMVHRSQILNIDSCSKIISKSFVPRFTTLGVDDEGRTYYALSPSVAEREAAFEYLQVASSEKHMKPKKKGRVLSTEDRRELRDWSWFIAVWGKIPPLSPEENAKKIELDSDNEEDEDAATKEEKWWGFWEPEEISKVADWISIKSGLEDKIKAPERETNSSSTSKPPIPTKEKNNVRLTPCQEHLKRLVSELKDYASLLEWRVRDDKCVLVSRSVGKIQASPNPSAKAKDKVSSTTLSDDQ